MALGIGPVIGSIGGKPYGWIIDPVVGRTYDLGDPPRNMAVYWSRSSSAAASVYTDGTLAWTSGKTVASYALFGPDMTNEESYKGDVFRTIRIDGVAPFRVCVFEVIPGFSTPPTA